MIRIHLEFGRSPEILRKTFGRPQLEYDAFFDLRTYGGKFKKRYCTVHFPGLGAGQKSSDMHDTIYKYTCMTQPISIKKEREMTNLDKFWDAQTIRAFSGSILVNLGFGSDRICYVSESDVSKSNQLDCD